MTPVQDPEEGTAGSKLGDNGQIWSLRARAHEHDHVGVLQALHEGDLCLEVLQAQPCLSHSMQALPNTLCTLRRLQRSTPLLQCR